MYTLGKQALAWCLTAEDDKMNYEKNKENIKRSNLKITP